MKKLSILIISLLIILSISVIDFYHSPFVFADDSGTTTDQVDVNNVAPTITYLNVTGDINSGGAGINLEANTFVTVYCEAIVVDENGAADIDTTLLVGRQTGYFWDANPALGGMLGPDGVDDHYTIDTVNDCTWSGPWTPPGYTVDVANTLVCSVDEIGRAHV